jgi:hypothetical protein
MKMIARWSRKAKVILLITVALFWRTWKIIVGNMNTGDETENPACVIHHNKWMGGIDLKDQLLQMYPVERKHMHKWYMKLSRRLLNATVLNADIAPQSNSISWHSRSTWFRPFSISLTLMNAIARWPKIVLRLQERRFIQKVPASGKKIYTTEEVFCMHQTHTEGKCKVLLSAA